MFFDDQNGYITAAYALTALVFCVLIIWVLWDQAKQRKAFAQLDAEGLVRKGKDVTKI